MPYLQPDITNYGVTPATGTGAELWQGRPLFEPASGIQGVPL